MWASPPLSGGAAGRCPAAPGSRGPAGLAGKGDPKVTTNLLLGPTRSRLHPISLLYSKQMKTWMSRVKWCKTSQHTFHPATWEYPDKHFALVLLFWQTRAVWSDKENPTLERKPRNRGLWSHRGSSPNPAPSRGGRVRVCPRTPGEDQGSSGALSTGGCHGHLCGLSSSLSRGCRSPQLCLAVLQTPLPGRGFLGWDGSGWGRFRGGAGRQRAPVSPPSSSPRQADGGISACCPQGLSDGFAHTSAAQGLPLVLIFLNKLRYSEDFSALICISISGAPPGLGCGCRTSPCTACLHHRPGCKPTQEFESTTSA